LDGIAYANLSPATSAVEEFFQQGSANMPFVSLRRFRTDAISREQPLLGKVLLQNRFPYAVEFMSIWFRSGGLGCRVSLLALVSAMASLPTSLTASETFSNTSLFYANSLTNQGIVRQDFDRFGGGFGSFEVNPQNGLELLSEAPDSYQGVRILRATLPASRSWEMLVKAHVDVEVSQDLSPTNRNAFLQEHPFYAAYLALVKIARGGDGSPSIINSTPNRAGVCLHQSDSPQGWQHYFDFYRFSGGVKRDIADIPLGSQPEILLRFRYSAAERLLTAGFSTNGGVEFFESDAVDLGVEWGLSASDEFGVYLEANGSPYSVGGEGDFWSNFDQDNSITPAPLPVYSVRSGEIFLTDFSISYVPSAAEDFIYEIINGSEVTITGYTGSEANVSVPQFIDGLPVTKIGSNAFSSKVNLVSVILPTSTTEVAAVSFANSPNLAAVFLPSTVHTIGDEAFSGSDSLRTVQLPANLVLQAERFGLGGELAFQELVQRVGASLAENELFMAALVTNEKFLGALTAKIFSRYEAYGLAARSDLGEFATKQDVQDGLHQSRTQGIQSVLDDPNSWSLYTADQVSGLSIGDLTLTRQENGSFVLHYDIEQSDDLETWTTYQNYGEELTGLPTNKKFIRIRVKE